MSLRIYIAGEDVTDQVDLSAASDMPSGPGHFPTEEEMWATLGGWIEYRGDLPRLAPGMVRQTITEGRRHWFRDVLDEAVKG